MASNVILVIRGQGIGPECIDATIKVLDATGIPITYLEGSLGYPDAAELFQKLKDRRPADYIEQFGTESPAIASARLEREAKDEARAGGNVNDFYKKLLARLKPTVRAAIKSMVNDLERKTLQDAATSSAVLKGALRTLDEGEEPSRNVTIRKAFEQYANIRRCVTLDPIAPGMKGTDILFVRENVEDLYASIEHRLGRNYPQALRHQTPEGCELICRAAFEAAIRDCRRKVTAMEKPNILKITGGLFKEVFQRVARDYNRDRLGAQGIEPQFMIIDDGLAAIAANPEKFDVVVTSNMFGDIGSDIAAKVTGGVGLVSSNNTNPNNPRAVSMFETMGGTADDIAGQDLANPVALIDAAAEMLLHIGGRDNIIAAEMIKTAVLEVLAEGYYVGDIRKGPYQEAKGKDKIGTQEFASRVADKVLELKTLKAEQPNKTIKEIGIAQAEPELQPLFSRVLRSYEQFADDMRAGEPRWIDHVRRNQPPNPIRSRSRIVGFDMFVDDSGMENVFAVDGTVDETSSRVHFVVSSHFTQLTGINLGDLFTVGRFGSLQSLRSFGQYAFRILRDLFESKPEIAEHLFSQVLNDWKFSSDFTNRFSSNLKQINFRSALESLEGFNQVSIKLIQAFYTVRAMEADSVLQKHGFKLVRITSRGTEIYPTMCDFEKREIDRFRVEINELGVLGNEGHNFSLVQTKIMHSQAELISRGWIISETMLNRAFTDGEGPNRGKEVTGVSSPYAKDLGDSYAQKEQYQGVVPTHQSP